MSFLSVYDGTQILLTGAASVYEQAYFMVTYNNAASEPTVGNSRTMNFQVFDGTFASDVASVTIAIQVIADSPVVLSSCG